MSLALQPSGTGPFPEVHGKSRANWNDVRAISLRDRAIDIRPWLIGSTSLKRGCRLSILQVKAEAEPFAVRRIGGVLENYVRLIQTERVAGHIIGAKTIYASDRIVEVEAVVPVEQEIDGSAAEKTGSAPRGAGRR